MRKLSVFAASLVAAFSLMLGPAALVYAQPNIQAGLCTGADLQFTENPTDTNCSTTSATDKINNIIHTIINLLSAVVGIVAVVMIIIGGLRYITSGGNDTGVASAKNTILYAIIGLIIVAFAQILVRFTLSKVSNG